MFEKELESLIIGDDIGIISATGTGKTTSIFKYLQSDHLQFQNVLYILPNPIVISKPKKNFCRIMTSYEALDHLLVQKNFNYDLIIVDEAHIDSKEYRCIFLFLKNMKKCSAIKFSIILVSATLPKDYFIELFPMLQIHEYDIKSKYTLSIEYINDHLHTVYPNKHNIVNMVFEHLKNNIHEKKILCFLPTHNDCEYLSKCIEDAHIKKKVIIFHGGVVDKNTVKYQCCKSTDCIILTTNIVESSITIPDIDLIIDSCLECRISYSSSKICYASKMSLIQRAGRAGRTKSGRVIRMLSKLGYDNYIDDFIMNDHDLSKIIVKCFYLCKDPINIFGDEIASDVIELNHHDVDESTSKDLLLFMSTSRYEIYTAKLAYRLQGLSSFSILEKKYIVLCLTVYDFYLKKIPYWFYFNKDFKMSHRKNIIREINNYYNVENDLLITITVILFSICLNENWKETANEHYFNLRELKNFYQNAKIIHHQTFSENIKDTFNLGINKKFIIPKVMIQKIRLFFWLHHDHSSRPYFFQYNEDFMLGYCFQPFYENSLPLKKNHLRLWTLFPEHFIQHQLELESNVKKQSNLIKMKDYFKIRFQYSIFSIHEKIAYMPRKYKMMNEMEHLLDLIEQYNQSLVI